MKNHPEARARPLSQFSPDCSVNESVMSRWDADTGGQRSMCPLGPCWLTYSRITAGRQAGLWSGFHSSAGLWRLNMNCCKSLAINTPCGCTCGPLVGLKKTLKALHHFHESNMFPEPALDFSCCQLCPWPTECECSSDKEKKSLFYGGLSVWRLHVVHCVCTSSLQLLWLLPKVQKHANEAN